MCTGIFGFNLFAQTRLVMKSTLFLIALSVVAHCASQAQTPDIIRIKGGVGGEKSAPFNARYRYGQFHPGRILYVNGTTATARLNYNILLGEMQFIDSRGDTLALADEFLLKQIQIDQPTRQDVYCFDLKRGYLQLLEDFNGIKLAEKQGLKMAKREKQGGYGQSTGSSAITTYQFYSSGSTSVSKLEGQGDLVLIKAKTYFIVDQNNRSYPANRASILKVFAKQREQVNAYLTSESIDFSREDSLKKLLSYCSELL